MNRSRKRLQYICYESPVSDECNVRLEPASNTES